MNVRLAKLKAALNIFTLTFCLLLNEHLLFVFHSQHCQPVTSLRSTAESINWNTLRGVPSLFFFRSDLNLKEGIAPLLNIYLPNFIILLQFVNSIRWQYLNVAFKGFLAAQDRLNLYLWLSVDILYNTTYEKMSIPDDAWGCVAASTLAYSFNSFKSYFPFW